jgi:hypothetical protein
MADIIFRILASLVIAKFVGIIFIIFWCNLPGRCLDMFGGVGPFVNATTVSAILVYFGLLYLDKTLERINKRYKHYLFYITIVITVGSLFLALFGSYYVYKESKRAQEKQELKRKENVEIIKKTTGVFYPTYFPSDLEINPVPEEIPFLGHEGRIDLVYYSNLNRKTVLRLEQSKISEWERSLSEFFSRPPIREDFIKTMRRVTLRDGTEALLIEHVDGFYIIFLDKDGLRIVISLYEGSEEDLLKIAESLQKIKY